VPKLAKPYDFDRVKSVLALLLNGRAG
jgi:hypothetical protein